MNALNVLCAQLTRDLFAIAKFLSQVVRLFKPVTLRHSEKCVDRVKEIKPILGTKSKPQ